MSAVADRKLKNAMRGWCPHHDILNRVGASPFCVLGDKVSVIEESCENSHKKSKRKYLYMKEIAKTVIGKAKGSICFCESHESSH